MGQKSGFVSTQTMAGLFRVSGGAQQSRQKSKHAVCCSWDKHIIVSKEQQSK